MKSVYVILTKTNTMFAKSIRMLSQSHFSHSSLAVDDNLEFIYSFGRKKPNNPFIAGFVREYLDRGVFGQCPYSICHVYRCQVSDEVYADIMKMISKFEKNKHKYKYNLLGIFNCIFNVESKREYNYICSQFVASVLVKSGATKFKIHPSLMRPDNFMDNENLELVYEGVLCKANNFMSAELPKAQNI